MSSIIKSSRVVEYSQMEKDNNILAQDQSSNKQAKAEYKEIIKTAKIEAENILKEARDQKKYIIEEAEDKKESLLQIAYDKSKDILEKSKKEGHDIGYEKGMEVGYSKGYDEGKKESDKLIKEALDIKEGYFEDRRELLGKVEKDVIELVIEIFEKIFREKKEEDSELIVSLVTNGIENLDLTDKLTIISSKEDYDILEMSRDTILAKASMISDLDIKYDTTMKKGDCILETPKGSIDASLDNQLAEVKEILHLVLNNE